MEWLWLFSRGDSVSMRTPPRLDESMFLICFYVVYFVSSVAVFVRRYVLVVDQLTLRPVKEVGPGRQVVMPVAAKYGEVRLLDNVEIGGEAP